MLSDRLVRLVETHASKLHRRWTRLLRENPATPSYHDIEDEELETNITEVYRHLGAYMERSHDDEKLVRFLMHIGSRRKAQRVPLNELVFAIILARRNIYDFIMEESTFTSTLEYHQLNEFWQRVMNFFDKNIYFVVLGYEHELDKEKHTKDLVSKLLHSFSLGAFPELEKEQVLQD